MPTATPMIPAALAVIALGCAHLRPPEAAVAPGDTAYARGAATLYESHGFVVCDAAAGREVYRLQAGQEVTVLGKLGTCLLVQLADRDDGAAVGLVSASMLTRTPPSSQPHAAEESVPSAKEAAGPAAATVTATGEPTDSKTKEAVEIVRRAGRDVRDCQDRSGTGSRVVEDLKRAVELWPAVPRASLVLARYQLACLTEVRQVCTAPDAASPRMLAARDALKQELQVSPNDAESTKLLAEVEAELARRAAIAAQEAEFTNAADKIAARRGGVYPMLTAAQIAASPKKYVGDYVVFCVDEIGATVQDFDADEDETRFELWGPYGRFRVVGPPLSGALRPSELQVFARIDGVVRGLSPAGTPLVIPNLRAVLLYDSVDGRLWRQAAVAGKNDAAGNRPGSKARRP